MITEINRHKDSMDTKTLCDLLDVPKASYYRSLKPRLQTPKKEPRTSHRKLPKERVDKAKNILHSTRFQDCAPASIYATLLDEGDYVCSIRTMYRILDGDKESKERRRIRKHPKYKKPELVATSPNQVWSWDITYFKTNVSGSYFFLYAIMDMYSRYIVGWTVDEKQTKAIAKKLLRETILKYELNPEKLIVHSDNGVQMKAKEVVQLYQSLGVTQSLNRPHVSNDNPFSESQFKTMKYHPTFPDKFETLKEARDFSISYFNWYNKEHKHSGIALLTPEMVHTGVAQQVIEKRNQVLLDAYNKNPKQFVGGIPKAPELPKAVYINPPNKKICSVTKGKQES